MCHGAFEGTAAAVQPRRVLILGESPHDIDPVTTMQEVMEEYLGGKHSNMFFQVARAFGAERDRAAERAFLWDKVFFRNYVDESLDGPHGEGDKTAKKLVAVNKERYNQGLAEFIRSRQIDVVFCFSNLAFDNLPPAPPLFEDVKTSRGHDLWFARTYGPDSLFGRRVEIYGAPHPSHWNFAGIRAEDVAKHARPVFEDCCGSP